MAFTLLNNSLLYWVIFSQDEFTEIFRDTSPSMQFLIVEQHKCYDCIFIFLKGKSIGGEQNITFYVMLIKKF